MLGEFLVALSLIFVESFVLSSSALLDDNWGSGGAGEGVEGGANLFGFESGFLSFENMAPGLVSRFIDVNVGLAKVACCRSKEIFGGGAPLSGVFRTRLTLLLFSLGV